MASLKQGARIASVFRTLVLVRHGHFSLDTLGLTPHGRRQAAFAARCLKDWPVSRIHCSTMKRAHETALILAKPHRMRPPARSHLLRECLPSIRAARRRRATKDLLAMVRFGKDQAERAYRRYFRRPARRNGCELLVSHGNLIRYFVGRVLGMGKSGWYQLGTAHCGITVIRIPRKGDLILDRYNDTGHIPRRWFSTL